MFPLGSRKYIFLPFFFADCCPPDSVNGTRCVPPGQLEPSRQLSWAKLPGAGTEPKDTKKPWNQLCLQQGLGQPFVPGSPLRQCDIKYSCAEPALPLCHCPRVPREGADTAARCPGTAQLPSGEPWGGETCSAPRLGADGSDIWLPGVCTRALFAGGQSRELL